MFHLTAIFIVSSVIAISFSHASQTCPRAERCVSRLEKGQQCSLLPMLPGTFVPPPGPQGFELTSLRPGVFHYSDDAYHSLILYSSHTRRLSVIDFPRSPNSITPDGTYLLTVAVMQVLKRSIPRTVDMVYSHRHFDHIGNAGIFKSFVEQSFPRAKISVWGTSEAKQFILRKESTDVPLPTTQIRKSTRTLSLSRSLKVQLSILGGHTDSDVLAYIPPSRSSKGVVHYVDVITAGEAPFIQFTLTIDLGRYLEAHNELLKLDFDFISTGHGKIGNKRDVRKNKEFTQFVIDSAKQAVQEVDPRQVGAIFARIANTDDAAYRNGAWALKSVLDLQVEICAKAVIRKWACRLSAVDVFANGHCLSAVLYNLVDQ